jgi:hypothetical protein
MKTETNTMRRSMLSVWLAAIVLGLGVPSLPAQEGRERLQQQMRDVNDAANKPGRMKIAMERISTETGVPLEQVRAMHKRQPGAGASGILIACVLAAETKKSPERFLDRHVEGKSWADIAHDNNVKLAKLNVRLDNVERALARDGEKRK